VKAAIVAVALLPEHQHFREHPWRKFTARSRLSHRISSRVYGKAKEPLKRPVLILGYAPRIVVPIARSLHRHGVPVDLADCVHWPRIASRSRAIREFVRIPYPPWGMDAFVTALRGFIVQHGHDMLIPADDVALAAIIERYDDFKDLVHVACPPPGVTRLVLNKTATLEIAQRCGIRVPRTVIVSNSGQLSEYIDRFPFPWVVKPVQKDNRFERAEDKSYILSSLSDITLKFPTVRKFTPPMLLQEFCPGIGVGVEMLMHEGNCVTVFQHRRLKEWPYTGGFSVTAVAERPDPALVESSLALLRALQWEGIAMVEFKVNPASRNAALMEVNGRYWGTISLPILAGMDFPLYHWQVVHGEQPEIPSTYTVGTKWRWTAGCLERLYGLLSAARYSAAARKVLPRELLHFSEDLSPQFRDATFTFSDPLPSIAQLFHSMRYFLFGSIRTLLKGLAHGLMLSERSGKGGINHTLISVIYIHLALYSVLAS